MLNLMKEQANDMYNNNHEYENPNESIDCIDSTEICRSPARSCSDIAIEHRRRDTQEYPGDDGEKAIFP